MKVIDRDRLRAVTVVVALAIQIWPLLGLVAASWVTAVVWYWHSGDQVLLSLAWWLMTTTFVGLLGSFAVHEVGHVLALRRCALVTHLTLERTLMRVSVVPHGEITVRQAVAVALAGPGLSAVVGLLLWGAGFGSLAWWYWAQLVFLLPVFGDGASIVAALRHRPSAEQSVSSTLN